MCTKKSDEKLPEIDITKEYTTRLGRPAKIFMTDGGGNFPVIGAYLQRDGTWASCSWTKLGSGTFDIDLIPAKKKGEFWMNVYPNNKATTNAFFLTRKDADKYCVGKRIACVRVKWEEGQFDD